MPAIYPCRLLVACALLLAPPTFAAESSSTEIDALTTSPRNFTLLLENEHVRVLRYEIPPGERDQPHTHPPRVSHVLSGGMLEIHRDGKPSFVTEEKAGDTHWSGSFGKHSVTNVGTTPVRILLVEDKSRTMGSTVPAPVKASGEPSMAYGTGDPAEWPADQDAAVSGARNHTVLFENEFVRVLDVTVAPGEIERVHHHRWNSVLYITESGHFVDHDASGKVIFDTRSLDEPLLLPVTMWKAPEAPHSVQNLSQTQPIRLVRFELKP